MALIFETSVWLLAESTRLLFSSFERTKKVRCSWFLLPFWRCAPSLLFLPLLLLLEGERNLFFFNNKRERINKQQKRNLRKVLREEEARNTRRERLLFFVVLCFAFGIHQQDSFPQTVLASLCCFFVFVERERKWKVYNKLFFLLSSLTNFKHKLSTRFLDVLTTQF